jgi:hypothetical protein
MDEDTAHRTEWKQRIVAAVVERRFDDETLGHLIAAGFDQAHSDGLADAAYICDRVAEARPHTRTVLAVIANAIRDLDARNRGP